MARRATGARGRGRDTTRGGRAGTRRGFRSDVGPHEAEKAQKPGRRVRFFLCFRRFLWPTLAMPRKEQEEEAPKKIASYTAKLDDAQIKKLGALLEARGWTPFEVGYTHFAFKADHLKVNVSAYTSGK